MRFTFPDTGRNSKTMRHGVCLVCRVYAFVALICLTRKCVRDSQRDEADEILTHGS